MSFAFDFGSERDQCRPSAVVQLVGDDSAPASEVLCEDVAKCDIPSFQLELEEFTINICEQSSINAAVVSDGRLYDIVPKEYEGSYITYFLLLLRNMNDSRRKGHLGVQCRLIELSL